MDQPDVNGWRVWGIAIAIAAVTLIVYWPVTGYGFVKFDDATFVSGNEMVKAGITGPGLRWAFAISDHDWVPLAYVSLMIDTEFFGQDAGGYHRTNLVIHTLNALILFGLLTSVTKRRWAAAVVALLFALHPQHVESVAWIAERRDVLFAFFGFLTIWVYALYARNPNVGGYIGVLLLYTCCLMSKQMFVTMPFALLLLDFWPLNRFGKENTRFLIVEKIPLLVLAIAEMGIVFSLLSKYSDMISAASAIPWDLRFSNAVVSYVAYLQKAILPTDLAIYYPLPPGYPVWKIAVSAVVLLAITTIGLAQFRRRRYIAVGWFWYLGTLFPTIGIVAHNMYSRADRYTYVPMVGVYVAVVWLVADWTGSSRSRLRVVAVSTVVMLAALALTAHAQLSHWQNSIALFQRAVDVTDDNYLAEINLASSLLAQDKHEQARKHFESAVMIDSEGHLGLVGMAAVLSRAGQHEQAIPYAAKAIEIEPKSAEGQFNLAVALHHTNRAGLARKHYEKAIEIRPEFSNAYYNLGLIALFENDCKKAIVQFGKTLELQPDHRLVHQQTGLALLRCGKAAEAVVSFQRQLQIAPNAARSHYYLGSALLRAGRAAEAVDALEAAIRHQDDLIPAIELLARILAAFDDATVRNGRRALDLANRTCAITQHKSPRALDVLAVAQAELGQFEEAVATATKAVSLAEGAGQAKLAGQIKSRIDLYKSGKPYRYKPSG